jgi:hypothetical protein
MLDEKKFLKSVQDFLANSFSVSVIRRMAPQGTLDCIRRFLKQDVDLAAISKNPQKFNQTLDALTEDLRRAMPHDARHWGVARKCLNLFFSGCAVQFLSKKSLRC